MQSLTRDPESHPPSKGALHGRRRRFRITTLVMGVGCSAMRRLRSRQSTSWILALLVLGAAVLLAWNRNLTHPSKLWMAPTFLSAWAWTGLFNVASFIAGWQCLRSLAAAPPRLLERVVLSHACGYVLFYLAMFLTGIIGLYSQALFWCLPLAMIAFGLPNFAADSARFWRRRDRVGMTAMLPRSAGETLALLLIAVSLVAIYLQIITPDNLCYDSRWYHLPVAEQYAAAGRIIRFNDGWYLGTYPQLSSLTYAWAMMAPSSHFDHLLLCSHIEYSLFVWTLLGVAALGERIGGRGRYLYGGAALFLFPSLFVYDSNLVANDHHILAYWVAPLTIAMIRFARRMELREAVLSALLTGAAICVKYQSCLFLAPLSIYLLWTMVRHRRLLPVVLWTSVVALVTASHWLKNLIYYHDPLYPILHRFFPGRPWHAAAAWEFRRAYWDPYFLPKGHGWSSMVEGLWAALTFPLTRIGRPILENHERPLIGALHLLLLPTVVFLRHRLRLLALAGAVYLGAVVWYFTSHQDRFLQIVLPWMAVLLLVILVQLWRQGVLVRLALSVLVAFQLLIAASEYFAPSHAMSGGAPIRASMEFLGRPYAKPAQEWNVIDRTNVELQAALPLDAKVLTHPMRLRTGLGRVSFTDEPGFQGAIEYLELESPDRVAALWRSMGVTHLITKPDLYVSSPLYYARELVYARTLQHYTTPYGRIIDGWRIHVLHNAPFPKQSALEPTRIGWLVCESTVPVGIYAPRNVGLHSGGASRSVPTADPTQLLLDANALIVRAGCSGMPSRGRIEQEFEFVMERDRFELWIRK